MRTSLWFSGAVTCAVAVPLCAQSPAVRTVATTPVEFASPFSSIANLVELADGNVLFFDAVERRLGVADLRSGVFKEVARQGAGPLEYRGVASTLRIPGDSVLIWDPGNGRILALAPDGKALGPWPHAGRDSATTALARMVPRETDASRRWYVPVRAVTAPDTTTLVRIDPIARRQDTLGRFATPRLRPVRSAEGVVKAHAPGFPPVDAWGVFPDGRVLFIHGANYQPEIINADGTRTRAAPVSFASLPVTDADRARHLKDVAAQLERMLGQELAGGRAATMPRVEAEPPATWPTHMPPLRDAHIRIDSRQRAWVFVTDPAQGTGARYDLLNSNGRRVDAVRLPKGVRLVGMGRGVFYGVREDEDGLLHLLRYPLP